MSINNIEQNVNGSNNFYSSEKADVSFFEQRTPQETINASKTGNIPGKFEYALRPDYFIPLEGCRNQIMQTYNFLNQGWYRTWYLIYQGLQQVRFLRWVSR